MERKIFGIIAVVLFAGILIGCGCAAVTTMSTQTSKTKDERKEEKQDTLDQESFLQEYFYGKWYNNDNPLPLCLTIDENTICGGTYRVVNVDRTDHPVLYYQDEIYGGGYTETRSIEYSQLWDIHSDVKALIQNDEYYFNISGEKLDAFLAEHAEDISREKQERANKKNPSSSNSGENNTAPQISQALVNKCIGDAKSRFEEWFLSNYTIGEWAGYNVRGDVRTQTSSSSVTVAFEMEYDPLLNPNYPVFSVVANYSIENGKASLFSFDVR